jgi:hypothetical protein
MTTSNSFLDLISRYQRFPGFDKLSTALLQYLEEYNENFCQRPKRSFGEWEKDLFGSKVVGNKREIIPSQPDLTALERHSEPTVSVPFDNPTDLLNLYWDFDKFAIATDGSTLIGEDYDLQVRYIDSIVAKCP